MNKVYVVTHTCSGWDPDEDSSTSVLAVCTDKDLAERVQSSHICQRGSCNDIITEVPLDQYKQHGWH